MANEYMSRGEMLPSTVVLSLVTKRLAQRDCVQNGWILDGKFGSWGGSEALSATKMLSSADTYQGVRRMCRVRLKFARRDSVQNSWILEGKRSLVGNEKCVLVLIPIKGTLVGVASDSMFCLMVFFAVSWTLCCSPLPPARVVYAEANQRRRSFFFVRVRPS